MRPTLNHCDEPSIACNSSVSPCCKPVICAVVLFITVLSSSVGCRRPRRRRAARGGMARNTVGSEPVGCGVDERAARGSPAVRPKPCKPAPRPRPPARQQRRSPPRPRRRRPAGRRTTATSSRPGSTRLAVRATVAPPPAASSQHRRAARSRGEHGDDERSAHGAPGSGRRSGGVRGMTLRGYGAEQPQGVAAETTDYRRRRERIAWQRARRQRVGRRTGAASGARRRVAQARDEPYPYRFDRWTRSQRSRRERRQNPARPAMR